MSLAVFDDKALQVDRSAERVAQHLAHRLWDQRSILLDVLEGSEVVEQRGEGQDPARGSGFARRSQHDAVSPHDWGVATHRSLRSGLDRNAEADTSAQLGCASAPLWLHDPRGRRGAPARMDAHRKLARGTVLAVFIAGQLRARSETRNQTVLHAECGSARMGRTNRWQP
jgi:hypothetical protein